MRPPKIVWNCLKDKKPPKGIRVLIMDSEGDISTDDVEDIFNKYKGKQSWIESHKFGNGTDILYWAEIPQWSWK